MSNSVDGPRAALNREVLSGIQSLIRTDPRTFVHQLFRMTGGERTEGGYGDAMVEEWVRRVPMEVAEPFYEARVDEGDDDGRAPCHPEFAHAAGPAQGCLMFTEEGFEDAVAALPHARVYRGNEKPSTSAEFVRVLREFCASLAAARA